jgi:hypothetical protein
MVILCAGFSGLLPATETPSPTAEPQTTQGSVARTLFTTHIVDREPADNFIEIGTDVQRVFFFSDLRELSGQIVTHRWEYQGKVMAEVKFKVGSPRWRTYSSKNLLPMWTGNWTVTVLDQDGHPLASDYFDYLPMANAVPAD